MVVWTVMDTEYNPNNNGYYIQNRNNSLTVPQIIITREFSRYMSPDNDNDNQETVMSKASISSIGRLKQMLRVVDARRQQRIRKSFSFLGTTLPEQYEQRHQTSNYKWKFKVYTLLHRPRGFWAFLYHVMVFLMVFLCLILTVFSTDKQFEQVTWEIMVEMEKIMVVWFGVEFLVRMWASTCKPVYQGWRGKLRFLRDPLRIGDIILILVSVVLLWVNSQDGHLVFAAFTLRGFHRFFQVIQMMKTERRFRPATILYNVLSAQREQLIITFYVGFLVLCFMAFLIYLIETEVNDYFDNIADSFWWAIITIFTIGYGDRVPVTWLGKLITCIFTILGVSIFALPAGIIGTGLAMNVAEEQRNESRAKKREPAALLIQCCWRYYAANPESLAVATWTIHRRHYDMISEKERNAIRFIRIIKLILARQLFASHRTQTDVRDVLEQYRIGHSAILYRIKEIESDISKMVGKVQTNGRRMQESRSGLVERIQALESSQKLFDTKVDVNFELLLSQLNQIQYQLKCIGSHSDGKPINLLAQRLHRNQSSTTTRTRTRSNSAT